MFDDAGPLYSDLDRAALLEEVAESVGHPPRRPARAADPAIRAKRLLEDAEALSSQLPPKARAVVGRELGRLFPAPRTR